MLRRFLLIAAGILLLIGGGFWAIGHFSTPADPAATAKAEREAAFEADVQAAAAAPSVIDYAALDGRLQRLIQEPGMVGLSVAVIEGGQIRFLKGYGVTQAGAPEQVSPDTVFRWASLSKGVAGDMIALLAHRNQLSLFDPVGRWSPTLRLPAGNEMRATVADLMSHQLGLFGHAQDAKLEDGQDPAFLRSTLATLNAICAPGQCHAYQNVAFDASAEIVGRITGMPYAEAVRQQLFLPLGMTTASMDRASLLASPSWARPHVGGRTPRVDPEVSENYYRVPAAGGVNGTIKDLALWMRAQMGLRPNVLPPEALALAQAPRVNTPGETGRRRKFRERTAQTAYGLGWRVIDYQGQTVIGHHGGVRGYRSMIMFDPVRKAGIAALWNSGTSQPVGLEYEVMDMVYRLPFRDWLRLDENTPAQP